MSKIRKILFGWFLYPAYQIYRRVFRPKTYGVRMVLWGYRQKKVLMVRHTYGDTTMWHLPGGAYDPKTEMRSDAAKRELFEETGLTVSSSLHLFTYKTNAQGNDDTVEVYLGMWHGDKNLIPTTNDPEVAELKWFDVDDLLETPKVYRITRQSIRALKTKVHT